jgi:enoyl-CoA hydratase
VSAGNADTGNIRTERHGHVEMVTLARPEYRNAQSRRLLEELDAVLVAAVDDPDVRVILLEGEGEHFSSGHDLGTREELADRQARPYPGGVLGEQRRSWALNVELTLRWRDLSKPTIAAVQGYCIYGGWMIASAMDLVVAADDAMFLPAHFRYFSVPWDLGVRRTKELLWLAEFVSGAQAVEFGLANHVVPRAELHEFALDLATRIARQDPFVAAMTKRSVNEMQDLQGFRNHITAAHSTYMQMQLGGKVAPRGEEGAARRLPGVARSLKDRGDGGSRTEGDETTPS